MDIRYCKICHVLLNPVVYKRKLYCIECKPLFDRYTTTIGSLRKTRINQDANIVYDSTRKPRICEFCGYDKHIEVCHIKAISHFNKNTPLAVVNAIDNLMALCPNCHWEYDRDHLNVYEVVQKLEDIPKLKTEVEEQEFWSTHTLAKEILDKFSQD